MFCAIWNGKYQYTEDAAGLKIHSVNTLPQINNAAALYGGCWAKRTCKLVKTTWQMERKLSLLEDSERSPSLNENPSDAEHRVLPTLLLQSRAKALEPNVCCKKPNTWPLPHSTGRSVSHGTSLTHWLLDILYITFGKSIQTSPVYK